MLVCPRVVAGREARAERHSTLRRGRALFSSTAAMSSAFSSPTGGCGYIYLQVTCATAYRKGRVTENSPSVRSAPFPAAQGGGRKRKLKEAEQDIDSNHSGGEDGNGGSSAVQDMARTQELMNRIAEVEDEKRTILEGQWGMYRHGIHEDGIAYWCGAGVWPALTWRLGLLKTPQARILNGCARRRRWSGSGSVVSTLPISSNSTRSTTSGNYTSTKSWRRTLRTR